MNMKTVTLIKDSVKEIYEETYKDGEICIGCEHRRIIRERRPGGDTYAVEILRECIISEINECPGIIKEGEYENHRT